jgi:hypothetical protein
MRLFPIFLGALILACPIESDAGGFAQVHEVSYSPLMQSKNGRIHNCGVHFKAAIQQENNYFAVLGSLNEVYFKNKIPAISIKILVQEFRGGKFLFRELSSGYLRGKEFSTTDFAINMKSSENGAWLAMTNMERKPNVFPKFVGSLLQRPWIGFNLGDGSSDVTFQLPQPKKSELFKDIRTCSIQAIDQVRRELAK